LPAGTETAAGKLIENAFALNKFRPLKYKKNSGKYNFNYTKKSFKSSKVKGAIIRHKINDCVWLNQMCAVVCCN